MSDAPERITAWGDQATLGVVYKAGPRPMQNMVPFRATEYTRADLSDALLREAMEALGMAVDDLDEWVACGDSLAQAGFNMDGTADCAERARATLAKLRSHMGGNHE